MGKMNQIYGKKIEENHHIGESRDTMITIMIQIIHEKMIVFQEKNSYNKNSKNNGKYDSKSRSSISNSYQKESGSSNSSSSSSYSDKSEMHYPYTLNEIISGKYRVIIFLFNYFLIIFFPIGTKTFI